MNKITRLFFLPVLGVSAFAIQAGAQITITSADLPTAGANIIIATDSMSGLLPGSPSASAQTWNFGALKHQKTATVSFKSPSATPYASAFPLANLVDTTTGVVGYNYFNNSSSQFAVQGIEEYVTDATYKVSFLIELNLSPVFMQSTLPATYGNKYSNVSYGRDEFAPTGLVAFVYDSIKVTTKIIYSDTVDAFGTMTTPTGTYSVLRQNHRDVEIDTAEGRSSSGSWTVLQATKTTIHEYNFYSNGVGYILAQVNMDTTSNTVKSIVWDSTAPAGINEISFSGKVSAYPNPCVNQITFTTTGNQTNYINVFDVTGRKVEQVEMNNGKVNVNTGSFAAGMYLYTMTDKDGNTVDHGKFMVK